MSIELVIDSVLATGIILLACLCLTVKQVFTSIVLYVSLGLMATMIWVRLNAWDVAIAEAAIGAGITGALLLVAWRKLSAVAPQNKARSKEINTENKHVP